MNIRRADCLADMRAVWHLTYRRYLDAGWIKPKPERECRHHPAVNDSPLTRVWLAEEDDELLGSISVTADGPHGLSVDAAFAAMAMATRDAAAFESWRLGAAWRFVVRPSAGCCVCRALLGAFVDDIVEREIDVVLHEVHPRYARSYERIMGFKVIDQIEHNEAVGGAPAVLMLGRRPEIVRKWKANRPLRREKG